MDLATLAIGIAIGLALAAGGWTFSKIGHWAEAKIESIEARTLHTQAVTSVVTATQSPAIATASVLGLAATLSPLVPAAPAPAPAPAVTVNTGS